MRERMSVVLAISALAWVAALSSAATRDQKESKQKEIDRKLLVAFGPNHKGVKEAAIKFEATWKFGTTRTLFGHLERKDRPNVKTEVPQGLGDVLWVIACNKLAIEPDNWVTV